MPYQKSSGLLLLWAHEFTRLCSAGMQSGVSVSCEDIVGRIGVNLMDAWKHIMQHMVLFIVRRMQCSMERMGNRRYVNIRLQNTPTDAEM
jgi:hypothetical protein